MQGARREVREGQGFQEGDEELPVDAVRKLLQMAADPRLHEPCGAMHGGNHFDDEREGAERVEQIKSAYFGQSNCDKG